MNPFSRLQNRHYHEFSTQELAYSHRFIFANPEVPPRAETETQEPEIIDIQQSGEMRRRLLREMNNRPALDDKASFFQELTSAEIEHIADLLSPEQLRDFFHRQNLDQVVLTSDERQGYVDAAVAAHPITENASKDAELLQNILEIESTGNVFAVSSAKALGVAQMMPSNYGLAGWDFNPFDPEQAILYQALYLKENYEGPFASDTPQQRLAKTIASYVAGVDEVQRAVDAATQKGNPDHWPLELSGEAIGYMILMGQRLHLSLEPFGFGSDFRIPDGDTLAQVWQRFIADVNEQEVPAWLKENPNPTPWEIRQGIGEILFGKINPSTGEKEGGLEQRGKRRAVGRTEKAATEAQALATELATIDPTPKTEKERREKLVEGVDMEQVVFESSWHDAYMLYRDRLLPAKRAEWLTKDGTNSHPEYIAANPEEQSAWIRDGKLIPGLLEDVLAYVIPPKDSVYLLDSTGKKIPVTRDQMIFALKAKADLPSLEPASINTPGVVLPATFTANTALKWVAGLEKYIYYHERPGGHQERKRAAMEALATEMKHESSFGDDLIDGIVEKFTSGSTMDTVELGILGAAIWKLYKSAPDYVKTLLWGGAGLYVFDKFQAEHTNLLGGKRLLDLAVGTGMQEIRDTPAGALLHLEGLTGDIEKKGMLVLQETPIDVVLEWASKVIAAQENDLYADHKTPKALYYDTMEGMEGLRKRFQEIFPEYVRKNDFSAAAVLWKVAQAILLRGAKKAHAFDNTLPATSLAVGIEYYHAKYTGKTNIAKPFQKFRDMIGGLREDGYFGAKGYANNPPTVSRVLEHEMTRYEIEKSIRENQSIAEKIKTFGVEQWNEWSPVLDGAWDWSLDEIHDAMEWLEQTGFPKGLEIVKQLARVGFRISAKTYNYAQGKITGFLNDPNVLITIEKIGDGAKWLIKGPIQAAQWTIETGREQMPYALMKLQEIGNWAGGWVEEVFGEDTLSRELVSIGSGKDIVDTLRQLDMVDEVMQAYGFVREQDLLNFADEMFTRDGGDWLINHLQETLADAAKTRKWIDTADPAHPREMVLKKGSLEVPRSVISSLFLLNAPIVDQIVWAGQGVSNGATATVRFASDGVKLLGHVANLQYLPFDLGFERGEEFVWNAAEALAPDTPPSVRSLTQMRQNVDIMIKGKFQKAEDTDDIKIWIRTNILSLGDDVIKEQTTTENQIPMIQRQAFRELIAQNPELILSTLTRESKALTKANVKETLVVILNACSRETVLRIGDDQEEWARMLGQQLDPTNSTSWVSTMRDWVSRNTWFRDRFAPWIH